MLPRNTMPAAVVAEHTSAVAEHTSVVAEHISVAVAHTSEVLVRTSGVAVHTLGVAVDTLAVETWWGDVADALAAVVDTSEVDTLRLAPDWVHTSRLDITPVHS